MDEEYLFLKLDSFKKRRTEKEDYISMLEENRMQNEARLIELIEVVKKSKEAGILINYPLAQIKEIDELLIKSIEDIKKEVKQLEIINKDIKSIVKLNK
jgi:hypothetical protein